MSAQESSRSEGSDPAEPSTWSQAAVIDFGKTSRLHRFARAIWKLGNPCDQARRLIGLSSTCACHRLLLRQRPAGGDAFAERVLAPGILPVTVAAGEQFEVAVEIDTQRIHERIVGRVSLATDDPGCPLIAAELAGTVADVFEIDPPVLDVGAIARGVARDESLPFTIRRTDGQKFQITDLIRCPEGMFADFHALDGEWTTWIVRAKITGIEGEGPFDERILFVAADGSHGACRMRGETPWSLRLEPAGVLYLGRIEPGRAAKGAIKLEADDPGLWQGLRLAWVWHSPEPEGLKAELKLQRSGERSGSVAVEWMLQSGHRLPAGLYSGEARFTHVARELGRAVYVQGFLPAGL